MSKDTEATTHELERRQLLRIEDTAIVELSPLPNVVSLQDGRPDAEAQAAWASANDKDGDKLFYLMRELQSIDQQTNVSFNALRAQAPDLAACLDAINRKINSIGETLCDDMFDPNEELQAIDLSTGGIGFNHPERLVEGGSHKLKLWFDASHIGICAQIKVLACNRAISGGFHISAAFTSISDTDQQIVSRHIAEVEAQMRRDAAALTSILNDA